MNKYLFILLMFSVIGCTHPDDKKQLSEKDRKELIMDSKILNSLDDSLYKTNDYRYYEKYMLKIDEMIKKYPDPYRKNYLQVKESMKEIYRDGFISPKAIK